MKSAGTALFSLNDTTRAAEFAEQLISAGWKILASTETAKVLKNKKIPVLDIANFTNIKKNFKFPPTLHPKIESALTTNSKNSIDLVYILTYPNSKGADVGGHTVLALAAKGRRVPITNNKDMEKVVKIICNKKKIGKKIREELILKANYQNSKFYMNNISRKKNHEIIFGEKSFNLMNGENPYQIPSSAFITDIKDTLSLLNLKRISGERPCFTNMADADCIIKTLCLVFEAFQLNMKQIPYICIAAKHGNACGVGVNFNSPETSIKKALWGNPRSIWGGELITNFRVDDDLADMILKNSKREKLFNSAFWMLDLVIAPSFSKNAIKLLGKRKKRKLFENIALKKPFTKKNKNDLRMVRGGFLVQPSKSYILNLKKCKNINFKNFNDDKIISMIIAWAVAFSSSHGGNEVAIAKDSGLIGAGGGPSTIEATKVAIERSRENGHNSIDAVFAADAFFAFDDAPKALIAAGCDHGIVPGGGKMFNSIKKYFADNNVVCGFIPEKYRGFCRH